VASTRDQRASEIPVAPRQVKGKAATADTSSPHFKYTRYDDSVGSTHNLVVELVPEGSSVLEFGCATGYMSDVLATRRGCRVTGIELDPEAAAEAKAHCERVIVGDAEILDLDEHLGDERFDAVLFADVLEHLRDPAAMLRRVRPFVAEGGAVVASIPNVAHVSVRLALLSGEFRYRDIGLLDDTHLRFFTRESIVDLFESAGFVVSTWRRRRIELSDAEIGQPAEVPEGLGSWLGSDPELTTYQFVVRAVPSEAASQLQDLRTRLDEADLKLRDLAKLEEKINELTETRGELEVLRRAHEAQARHLISERLSFADQIGELDGVIDRLREEVEWRRGVMEAQEQQLATLQQSRSLRYTEPLRRIAAALRR
jgi:2-polyprenyl-3-methyl-5-hydroxy-6-metoxy-1,4-benzoquinol methylase